MSCDTFLLRPCKQHVCELCHRKAVVMLVDEETWLADVLNQEQDVNAYIFRKFKVAAFTFVKQKLLYYHYSSLCFRAY